jgi:hypothetical protein
MTILNLAWMQMMGCNLTLSGRMMTYWMTMAWMSWRLIDGLMFVILSIDCLMAWLKLKNL